MVARRGSALCLPVGAIPCGCPLGQSLVVARRGSALCPPIWGNPLWLPRPTHHYEWGNPCGCPIFLWLQTMGFADKSPGRHNHRAGKITGRAKSPWVGQNHRGGHKAPPLRRSRRTARKSLFFHGHHPQCYTRKSSGLFCGCHLTVGGKITIGGQNHGGGQNHQGWTQSPGRAQGTAPTPDRMVRKMSFAWTSRMPYFVLTAFFVVLKKILIFAFSKT